MVNGIIVIGYWLLGYWLLVNGLLGYWLLGYWLMRDGTLLTENWILKTGSAFLQATMEYLVSSSKSASVSPASGRQS